MIWQGYSETVGTYVSRDVHIHVIFAAGTCICVVTHPLMLVERYQDRLMTFQKACYAALVGLKQYAERGRHLVLVKHLLEVFCQRLRLLVLHASLANLVLAILSSIWVQSEQDLSVS